ncbi:hypothetical protein KIN20_025940 [Parelaphostrongylus tenuis]|uniref:Nucleolar complex protein 2 homolog n=1 Tax=Parelaphostrongylus tenuis TaxID=148309 RepID=A0AAD5N009_PARTN|nr:hypothetical protein KIN20_025940 [Parelaphostrongylus tenuis]
MKSKHKLKTEGMDKNNVDDVNAEVSEEKTPSDSEIDEESVVATGETKEVGIKHLNDLKKLKESDPEFYKFLQDEDADLLQFEVSDEDDQGEDDEIEHRQSTDGRPDGRPGQPKGKKDYSGRIVFDGRMLDYLQGCLDAGNKIQSIHIEDIRLAVEAFTACVSRVGADIDVPKYAINEQKVFYGTIRLCFERLGDIFTSLIIHKVKADPESITTAKSKRTPSVLTFLNEVQTSDIILSTLKAILRIVDLYAFFKKITKNLSRVLVQSSRTLCYFIQVLLSWVRLEFSYRHNTTWPLLHFAHRTFAELTVLHPHLAYPYAFVYIRQMAIHLRNATISKKRKDMVQTVYNWQMMQCLYLWTRAVSKANSVADCEAISELTYPLVQVIYGILKLYQSLRYIPLRLHCISLLIQIQANCGVFIPTMTLAAELMGDVELILAKKPKTSKNVKIVDLDCSLKVNALVLEELSWRRSLCDYLFRILLQAAHLVCAQPCFPDIIVPVTFRIRNFLREIRSAEFVRCFRILLDKLEEHAKYVANALLVKEFSLKNDMQIMSLKSSLSNPNSPLRVYYRQWENVWRMTQGVQKIEEKKEEKEEAGKVIKKEKQAKRKREAKEAINPVMPKKIRMPTSAPTIPGDETIPDEFDDLGNWSDSD